MKHLTNEMTCFWKLSFVWSYSPCLFLAPSFPRGSSEQSHFYKPVEKYALNTDYIRIYIYIYIYIYSLFFF